MKSWKTTLFGALTALAIYFKTQPDGLFHTIGIILEPVSIALIGWFARDNSVSSEAAGAK